MNYQTQTQLSKMSDVIKDSNDENNDLHCSNCEKTFTHKRYIKVHQTLKMQNPSICLPPNALEQNYKCDKCTAAFKLKPGLYRHIREIHEKQKRPKETPAKCDICQKVFPRGTLYEILVVNLCLQT